jgi:hypothetical protein
MYHITAAQSNGRALSYGSKWGFALLLQAAVSCFTLLYLSADVTLVTRGDTGLSTVWYNVPSFRNPLLSASLALARSGSRICHRREDVLVRDLRGAIFAKFIPAGRSTVRVGCHAVRTGGTA